MRLNAFWIPIVIVLIILYATKSKAAGLKVHVGKQVFPMDITTSSLLNVYRAQDYWTMTEPLYFAKENLLTCSFVKHIHNSVGHKESRMSRSVSWLYCMCSHWEKWQQLHFSDMIFNSLSLSSIVNSYFHTAAHSHFCCLLGNPNHQLSLYIYP